MTKSKFFVVWLQKAKVSGWSLKVFGSLFRCGGAGNYGVTESKGRSVDYRCR